LDYQQLSDAELVTLCRQGRQAAWSTLVRRFQRLVYTIPRRARLPDQSAADVFQITFSRLFEHIDRLAEPARVRAWLVTTARRETLKQLRSSERVEVPASARLDVSFRGDPQDASEAGGIPESPWSDPDDAEMTREERWNDVRNAVDRLDPRCRLLIELLFLNDPELAYVEVGRRLDMPPGSIGPTRARCLAQLRKLLAQ
jgi:RNA polymerase sigma factor (sigma-70 family)